MDACAGTQAVIAALLNHPLALLSLTQQPRFLCLFFSGRKKRIQLALTRTYVQKFLKF